MKYLIRIITILITFAVGLQSSFFYNTWLTDLPQVQVEVSENLTYACKFAPSVVSLCELDSFPDKYDGKWVITEATVFANGYGENVLYPINWYESCETLKDIHFTFLELKDFKKFQIALKNSKPYHKEVNVRINGMVKIINEKHIGKSYLIIPDTIEIISPFRKFTAKAAA